MVLNIDKKIYILGFETSGKTASVCIFDNENNRILGEFTIHSVKTQSQIILPMARDLMQSMNINSNQLDSIAITTGPGSYTGIRIGLSAAKAIAFAENIKIYGITSLEAQAFISRDILKTISVIHARTDLYYTAVYDNKNCCKNPCIMQLDEICKLAVEISENNDFAFCGEDSKNIYDYFIKNYNKNNLKTASYFIPEITAKDVCQTIKKFDKQPENPENVNATYFQKTEAERNLDSKLN